MKKLLIYIITAIILYSCYLEQPETIEKPVASVHDKFLYEKDLNKLFRQKVSEQDSITIVKNYIDNWIREQLMLQRAELNLTEDEKDVQEKLNHYRNSLLIYKYQDHFIKQNLDTVITYDEVLKYYEENTPNFILDNNLVKALYIKINHDIPNDEKYQLRRWLRSTNESDGQSLYKYCMQNAENFDDFNSDWVVFNMIQIQFPQKINNPENTLRWKKHFETQDTSYYYFLRIDDFVPKSEVTPLDYIEEKIKSIILNKRKITMIKQLEKEVYNDALNRDMVKIY